jgi:flavin reductase (DIM6/NTAB) family NADH-FMN oxidoreductase RutF
MLETKARMSVDRDVSTKVRDFREDQMLARKAFSQFPSGVSVLATDRGGEKHAMVASSFMVGVSLDPCLVAVAVQKSSATWPQIRQAESIGVSIFAQGQGPLTRQLAGRDRAKRFDEVAIEINASGTVYIEDAALWLETTIHQEADAGDHWMVLLEVSRLGVNENTEPLLWHGSRFREFATETSFDVE